MTTKLKLAGTGTPLGAQEAAARDAEPQDWSAWGSLSLLRRTAYLGICLSAALGAYALNLLVFTAHSISLLLAGFATTLFVLLTFPRGEREVSPEEAFSDER